jgi:hypothetical protein
MRSEVGVLGRGGRRCGDVADTGGGDGVKPGVVGVAVGCSGAVTPSRSAMVPPIFVSVSLRSTSWFDNPVASAACRISCGWFVTQPAALQTLSTSRAKTDTPDVRVCERHLSPQAPVH